ncbi:MAG TPA: hypothetical protein PLO16_15000 [Acidocella sp.]|nr:hypothetical protein [Acidocella sp.]
MTVITVDFAARRVLDKSPHIAFCIARQEMMKALQAWLAANPEHCDVADEIDGTTNAMTATAALLLTGGQNA